MIVYVLLAKVFGQTEFSVFGVYYDESEAIRAENYQLVGCDTKIEINFLKE